MALLSLSSHYNCVQTFGRQHCPLSGEEKFFRLEVFRVSKEGKPSIIGQSQYDSDGMLPLQKGIRK